MSGSPCKRLVQMGDLKGYCDSIAEAERRSPELDWGTLFPLARLMDWYYRTDAPHVRETCSVGEATDDELFAAAEIVEAIAYALNSDDEEGILTRLRNTKGKPIGRGVQHRRQGVVRAIGVRLKERIGFDELCDWLKFEERAFRSLERKALETTFRNAAPGTKASRLAAQLSVMCNAFGDRDVEKATAAFRDAAKRDRFAMGEESL